MELTREVLRMISRNSAKAEDMVAQDESKVQGSALLPAGLSTAHTD